MASSLWRIPTLVALFEGGGAEAVEEGAVPEYQLKAMYLGRLAALVEFPGREPGKGESGVFAIGVLGISPFRAGLDRLMDTKTVRGFPIRVKYTRNIEDLLDCNMVFICESEDYLLEEILGQLRGRPILTVSDTPESSLKGVMVNFTLEQRRIALEVNLKAVKSSGLVFSSFLLKISKVVR